MCLKSVVAATRQCHVRIVWAHTPHTSWCSPCTSICPHTDHTGRGCLHRMLKIYRPRTSCTDTVCAQAQASPYPTWFGDVGQTPALFDARRTTIGSLDRLQWRSAEISTFCRLNPVIKQVLFFCMINCCKCFFIYQIIFGKWVEVRAVHKVFKQRKRNILFMVYSKTFTIGGAI